MKHNQESQFAFSDHMGCLQEMFCATKEAILRDQLSDLGVTRGSLEDIEYAVRDFVSQLERLDDGLNILSWLEEKVGPLLEEHGVSKLPHYSNRKTTDDLREFFIQVTQGMINQSLLTLTQPKKEGIISESECFTITLPWGQQFTTEIKQPGNRLSERGLISKFYSKANVKEGDCIQLKEYEHGHWKMSKSTRAPIDLILENLNIRGGQK